MKRATAKIATESGIQPAAIAYQAKIAMPCAVLGIRTLGNALVGVDFLPLTEPILAPSDVFTQMVCNQVAAYLRDSDFMLDVPLRFTATAHQNKVWQALRAIPRGSAQTYGMLAQQLASSPRAVGGACGDNPIPLFIPCHRVVAKNGGGGFMHQASGAPLAIKAWLLRHEGWQR